MQEYFYELSDYLKTLLRGLEVYLASLSGEDSDFVRINRTQVRQAGHVTQQYLTIDLIDGQRHAKATTALSGDRELDQSRLAELVAQLRGELPHVQDDPYLLYSTQVQSSQQIGSDTLPPREQALGAILTAGAGRDMVGIYAAGGIYAGFANSLGQRNWFAAHSFNFDWTFYHQADKAVKCNYSDFTWNQAAFERKLAVAAEHLEILAKPARTIQPGKYRVYLAPAALEEFMSMLCWGGFGCKSHKTRSTPLLKMIAEDATLAPPVTIRENTAGGIAPNFQSAGYVKPPAVTFIEAGRYKDCLVSPRSAKEYNLPTNGASSSESPESLEMAAGGIAAGDVLEQLGTGVYVNTLWYLNYSDRPAGRITGMTRFATFWVEGGKIVAPMNVMRFDETVYRVLGENLLGLTADREFMPSTSTYGGRSTGSSRLPGLLVKDFEFTL